MFTPPPSPLPPKNKEESLDNRGESSRQEESQSQAQDEFLQAQAAKQKAARRFRLTAVLVPFLVIALTICATCMHNDTFDDSHLPPSYQPLQNLLTDFSIWRVQKREPAPQAQSSTPSSTSILGTSTTTSTASVPLPTVPSSPPVLPTPFPQAFDGTLQQNFSSTTCLSFFTNMTNSLPFRSCRPFSFLLQTSTTFLNAQTNLTLMNNLVWGMCNTNVAFPQCKSNMAWFASTIKTACADDLIARSTMATGTLLALQAFPLMHDAACLEDPTTNSYCFVNAARSSNPSDLYYYQLPLGTPLPSNSSPSCSTCSKSLMALYASALKDSSQAAVLTGLKATYEASAQLSAQFCGSSFASMQLVGSAISLVTSTTSIIFAFASWTVLSLLS